MAYWSKKEKRAAARLFARALPIQPPSRAPPQLNLIHANGGTTINCWWSANNGNNSSSSTLSSLTTNVWDEHSKYNYNNNNTEREAPGIMMPDPDPSDVEVRI